MLEHVKKSIKTGNYLVTRHAKEEMTADDLTLDDILASVGKGEVIEDYPQDFPFQSCLIFGYNGRKEPVHGLGV